jgi:WD40 repeat protein
METGACELVLSGHTSPALCVAVLSDGRVMSGSLERVVRVWDLGDAAAAPRLLRGHADAVRVVGELQDGRLFSASDDGTLRLWSRADGRADAVLRAGKAVLSAAQLLSGELLTGCADGSLRLWPLPEPSAAAPGGNATLTATCTRVMTGHAGPINALAVPAPARDGARAVSGGADGDVRVWNADTGACLRTLSGHKGSVTGVALLQEGLLVSVSMDRTVRVWDADVGSCERTLTGHRHWVNAVLVLADNVVVTASSDRTLRFWRAGECHLVLPREEPAARWHGRDSGGPADEQAEDAALPRTPHTPQRALEVDVAGHAEGLRALELSPGGSDWQEEVARWEIGDSALGTPAAAAGELRPWAGIEDESPRSWLRSPATGGAAALGAVALIGVFQMLRGGSSSARRPAPTPQSREAALREERRRRRAAAAAARR